MKINAISATMFASRQGITKKAVATTFATAGSALAADTFVKGLSKPVKETDDILIIETDEEIFYYSKETKKEI